MSIKSNNHPRPKINGAVRISVFLLVLPLLLCACGTSRSADLAYRNHLSVETSVSDQASQGFGLAQDLVLSRSRPYAQELAAADPAGQDLCLPDEAPGSDTSGNPPRAILLRLHDPAPLFAKDVYEPIAPASLTKLLTALMVLKYGQLSDTVTISEDMMRVNNPEAQMCGFTQGDAVTVETLFNCMLVYSGNDTANALALYLSPDLETFCSRMNAEAAALGATHTHFVNPTGLDEEGHTTCVYDLYLFFNACMAYPEFREAISQTAYTARYVSAWGGETEKTFYSTNLYFTGGYEPPEGIRVLGGKTGTTGDAGTCLILLCADETEAGEDEYYIAAMLGCPDKPTLYTRMTSLLTLAGPSR